MAWDRNQMRREKSVRMELAGYSDIEIQDAIGLTAAGLANMKQQPEYKEVMGRIKFGIMTDMDAAICDDITAMQKKMRENLPHALQKIIDGMHSKNEKLAIDCAQKVIDIDGALAAVSKIEVTAPAGLKADTDVADAIQQALAKRRIAAQQNPTIDSPSISESPN